MMEKVIVAWAHGHGPGWPGQIMIIKVPSPQATITAWRQAVGGPCACLRRLQCTSNFPVNLLGIPTSRLNVNAPADSDSE